MRERTDKQEIPLCGIRVDKEGVWYFHGAEMFRREIVNHFYQHLLRDANGRYIIEMGNERCRLEVEDTPFVVRSVYSCGSREDGDESLSLVMCDESVETLNPSTLRVGKDNVLYCGIRNGNFEARFSRASYYQIADYFDYDSEKDRFVLILNDRPYAINAETRE